MTPVTNYACTILTAGLEESGNISKSIRDKTFNWLCNRTELGAEEILQSLHTVVYPAAKTRYRFPGATKEAELIKAIFEIAFKTAPERVIAKAEEVTENPLYPVWKRVLWINTPQAISSVLGNPFVKIIISITVIYYGCVTGYKAYEATLHFVGARVVPFVINNTPLQIIRLFNTSMTLIEQVYNVLTFQVLMGAWIARHIILRGPEIPCVTPIARALNPFTIFFAIYIAPQTVGGFLFTTAWDASTFAWNRCNDMSLFFRDSAQRANAERLASSKQQAYALWVQQLGRIPKKLVGALT